MKYNIRGEKIKVTKAINNYITEKLSKMDKYFENPNEIEAKVLIKVKGIDQKVEVTINTNNYNLRVEEGNENLYTAIDQAIDKIERQFRKYKTKLIDKKRREEVVDEIEDLFEERKQEIVRRKEVFLKPIDEEEAMTQMELLGHSFFVFKNVDDGKVNVLYKRKDGNFGIIQVN